jgi:hypothetical protein
VNEDLKEFSALEQLEKEYKTKQKEVKAGKRSSETRRRILDEPEGPVS